MPAIETPQDDSATSGANSPIDDTTHISHKLALVFVVLAHGSHVDSFKATSLIPGAEVVPDGLDSQFYLTLAKAAIALESLEGSIPLIQTLIGLVQYA